MNLGSFAMGVVSGLALAFGFALAQDTRTAWGIVGERLTAPAPAPAPERRADGMDLRDTVRDLVAARKAGRLQEALDELDPEERAVVEALWEARRDEAKPPR